PTDCPPTDVCTRRKRTCGPQGGSPGLDPLLSCVRRSTTVGASRPEPPYFSANFIVATGQLPSWLPIEIRRPWSSSSQSLSTVPAFPLVRITALPTSSV